MENKKLITVLTATYGYELAVVQGKLESEGITCFLKDDVLVQVNPFLSNAIGGVKLQVLESDLNKAIGVLKEIGSMNDIFDEQQEKTDDNNEIEKKHIINCPNCNEEIENGFDICWNCCYSMTENRIMDIE